jgi:hypothetical protein
MSALPSRVRLVHLSDIHFSQRSGGLGFDPDEDLRGELRRDLENQAKRLGDMMAILVSGDIAYAGKKPEYESASKWLDELCAASRCPRDAVYLSPGNHDVDRDTIRANSLLQDAHDAIRGKADTYQRDTALKRRLEETEARNLFFAPLREFNEFAARYECSFFADAESYAWDRDIPLNDGSVLRVRGLNSALLSGLSDAEGTLFLGSRAWTMPRRKGVEYLTICHHPPSWLLDGRDAESSLDDRTRIQLFGHEHDLRVVPGRDQIKLFAGAVNPPRDEARWRPGYNIIEIWIETDAGGRKMIVEVHAREWQERPTQFRAHEDRNNNPIHRVELALDPFEPNTVAGAPMSANDAPSTAPAAQLEQPSGKVTPQMSSRELVNRFFRLSISRKSEIAGHLDLLAEADLSLPDFERYKRALLRAKERNLLDQLAELIVEAEK